MSAEDVALLPDALTREEVARLITQAVLAEREAAIAYLREIASVRASNNSMPEPYAQMAACLARAEHRSRAQRRPQDT